MLSYKINTNNSLNSLKTTSNNLGDNYERLSSGLRINKAADDSSGLAISERLTAYGNGKLQAQRNVEDGLSLLKTADGLLSSVQDMLQRVRELSVQADNDIYSYADKQKMQKEIKTNFEQIDSILMNSTYNDVNIFGPATDGLRLHIDETADGEIVIPRYHLSAANLGIDWVDVSVDAQSAINAVDSVIQRINDLRSEYGSYTNRLEYTLSNLETSYIRNASANSRISDADFAKEMSSLSKNELQQSISSSILKKSFEYESNVLQNLVSF